MFGSEEAIGLCGNLPPSVVDRQDLPACSDCHPGRCQEQVKALSAAYLCQRRAVPSDTVIYNIIRSRAAVSFSLY